MSVLVACGVGTSWERRVQACFVSSDDTELCMQGRCVGFNTWIHLFIFFIFLFLIIIITVTLGFACRAGVSVLISGYILGEALVRLVLHCDVTSFLTHGTELKKIYKKMS